MSSIIDRQTTHGEFTNFAYVEQSLKATMHSQNNWSKLTPAQKTALEMVQHKIARILTGDIDHTDHWDDIVGYGQRACESMKKAPKVPGSSIDDYKI
jgi:ribosomal protein S2